MASSLAPLGTFRFEMLCRSKVHVAVGLVNHATSPLLDAQSGRCAACLQAGGVDHHSLPWAVLGGKTDHQPQGYAPVDPSLPTDTEHLANGICRGKVTPAQAKAMENLNSILCAFIINAWHARDPDRHGQTAVDIRGEQQMLIRTFEARDAAACGKSFDPTCWEEPKAMCRVKSP
ncbi:hypothetical protein [Cognatishimia sp. F0-27]|uniref:hypothetical protein n=1 Tax=Cognatishimia sp. F0-27 TaxID=2816855 RepID=UPI001D0C349F|nr:hypothetical protein [Cognatishimia sp. F0-27]MCC1493198.1 hypothetical protein [Cognatishimia sp. F0-27]